MKNLYLYLLALMSILAILLPSSSIVLANTDKITNDLDPLVDIKITFELLGIRSLEKNDNHLKIKEYIDKYSKPDFFVKVFINGEKFQSNIWRNTRYIYDPNWSVTVDVPDDIELVNITIQLWDWNLGFNKICDISSDPSFFTDSYDVELVYSIKNGQWWGDDHKGNNGDPISTDYSGYGRLNGCDDGSIYQQDRDCELWFDIYQTDPDGDRIPYWSEVNIFETDPTVDDRGRDDDGDGIPYEWEYKYGHYVWINRYTGEIQHNWIYNPFIKEDHDEFDPDEDGLNNVEEYLTSQWGSDPFRKDLFVELDQMEAGPNGEPASILPEESKELLRTVYNRQNIVYHLDDGCMGGSDIIPFDESSTDGEIRDFFIDYFLHNDNDHWRRGVFHYGIIIYNAERWHGFVFNANAYQLSTKGIEEKVVLTQKHRDIAYASAYMHECGHTLGIYHGNTPGCDDQEGKNPFTINWWKWRPYKSVMNYGYMYLMLDYSDGSRGKNDFDDWNRLDLTYFENQWF